MGLKQNDALMKDAGIPTRIINVAVNMNRRPMTHLSHLASFTKRELLLEPNCGPKTLKQAEVILAAHGFSFAAPEKKTRKITTHEEKLIERIQHWRPADTAQSGELILVCTHRNNVYPTSTILDGMALCYLGGVDEDTWRFEWLAFKCWSPLPEPLK